MVYITHSFRHHQPAQVWTDAYPLGNGTLGAMVYGGVDLERISLNHDSFWSGSPASADFPEVKKQVASRALAAAQQAIRDADYARADQLLRQVQTGHAQTYLPLADLILQAHTNSPSTGYERWLDLAHGQAFSRWDGCEQEVWVSYPDQVGVLRRHYDGLNAGLTVQLAANLEPECMEVTAVALGVGHGRITATFTAPSRWQAPGQEPALPVVAELVIEVKLNGHLQADGTALVLKDFSHLDLIFAADVQPDSAAQARVSTGWANFGDLAQAHRGDFSELMRATTLELAPGTGEVSSERSEHTDLGQRILEFARGQEDPELIALAFQFGRYLTVASSRPGSLPSNLQGIWNQQAYPPWNSDYTININLQMNYWPTLAAGLTQCYEPLLNWLPRLAASGAQVARHLYAAPGWVAHHNSDAWGFAGPIGWGEDDPRWSFWPFGGVWLMRAVWDYYDFTGDDAPVRDLWPLITGATQFLCHWLAQPDAQVGTVPATSPENTYLYQGQEFAAHASTTSDLALARDLLHHYVRVGQELGLVAPAFGVELRTLLSKLAPEAITADGRIAEWSAELVDADPYHRHQTHLYGLYPGDHLTWAKTPELMAAASHTLDTRGPQSTGWSLSWRLALRARLGEADAVAELIRSFLYPVDAPSGALPPPVLADGSTPTHVGGVYRSLLCAHPPFQIDGNFGFTAGIIEALVHSHELAPTGARIVRFLPALPALLGDGALRGTVLRGNAVADLCWQAGELVAARITARAPWQGQIHIGIGPNEPIAQVQLEPGQTWHWGSDLSS